MDELNQKITRYLLGELPNEEQAALEKSYFKDPLIFDQVLQVESELLDAYARGQLSATMRERFEQSYLKHPSRRERVEFTKALMASIDERHESRQSLKPPAPVSWWQGMFATVGGQRLRLSIALAA